jgi:hypothetical protein
MYVGVDADEEAEAYDAIKNLTVDQLSTCNNARIEVEQISPMHE